MYCDHKDCLYGLCIVICVIWQGLPIWFVYYDLCILDRFMYVMYIVQSGLYIVFAHNGSVCLHTITITSFSWL